MQVVLVAPEIPQNTGSIGRLCVATESGLHLIELLGFVIDDKHLRRAGLDYWPHVQLAVHPDWNAFAEPYGDDGGGEVAMVTYAVPFRGARGEWHGVVTADVRLSRLDAIVQEIELGRNGFGLVISRGGVVIAVSRHDERVQPSLPVLEQTAPASRAALEPIVGRMQRGERGFVPVQLERGAFRLTWRPLARAGWMLAALYPDDELLAGVRRLRVLQASLAAAGLALLAFVVVVL